jgi:hypothetical protein
MMANISHIIESHHIRMITKNSVFIRLFKISFEENAKWSFVYEGDKIQAVITDPNFQKLIDSNEAFAKGDILKVDLLIHQEYDKSVQDYLNKSFEVIKLIEYKKADNWILFDSI